jgi:hypothetical protein
MEKGSFDPSQVARFHYPKHATRRDPTVTPNDSVATPRERPAASAARPESAGRERAEALANRPGGSPGRLRSLYVFHQWLASLEQQHRKPQQEKKEPLDPPTEKKENDNDGHDA